MLGGSSDYASEVATTATTSNVPQSSKLPEAESNGPGVRDSLYPYSEYANLMGYDNPVSQNRTFPGDTHSGPLQTLVSQLVAKSELTSNEASYDHLLYSASSSAAAVAYSPFYGNQSGSMPTGFENFYPHSYTAYMSDHLNNNSTDLNGFPYSSAYPSNRVYETGDYGAATTTYASQHSATTNAGKTVTTSNALDSSSTSSVTSTCSAMDSTTFNNPGFYLKPEEGGKVGRFFNNPNSTTTPAVPAPTASIASTCNTNNSVDKDQRKRMAEVRRSRPDVRKKMRTHPAVKKPEIPLCPPEKEVKTSLSVGEDHSPLSMGGDSGDDSSSSGDDEQGAGSKVTPPPPKRDFLNFSETRSFYLGLFMKCESHIPSYLRFMK